MQNSEKWQGRKMELAVSTSWHQDLLYWVKHFCFYKRVFDCAFCSVI